MGKTNLLDAIYTLAMTKSNFVITDQQLIRNDEDFFRLDGTLEKDEVTADDRRIAKTINFGVIYGMGSLKFSRSIGVDKKLANEFIQKFSDPPMTDCTEFRLADEAATLDLGKRIAGGLVPGMLVALLQ